MRKNGIMSTGVSITRTDPPSAFAAAVMLSDGDVDEDDDDDGDECVCIGKVTAKVGGRFLSSGNSGLVLLGSSITRATSYLHVFHPCGRACLSWGKSYCVE